MKLYGLKNCDSCKKALSQLDATGHEVDFFDIRTEPLDASQIADLLAIHGQQIMLNRKSTTWRNLPDSDRSLPPDTLMIRHPTLIKRPVIFQNDTSFVGWGKEVQQACGIR